MVKSDQENINYDLFWFQNMHIFNLLSDNYI